MIFANVRLPDEIRIALEEGRLVIFAGAGISMPPPSRLPSFYGLAREICGQNVQVIPGDEDKALGKQKEMGTDVHSAVARRLYNRSTHFTEAHRQVIRIFNSANKVRVVTTNFDDHFTAAARAVFRKQSVAEFYAPALPLGDDFEGIVYLHGSARKTPRKMVLTDKDF
jgi:NAD-dependent SIR2 family protein deacetylase